MGTVAWREGGDRSHAYSRAFAIDLGRVRWCLAPCRDSAPIAEVTAETIVLMRENEGDQLRLITIDRQSGALLEINRTFGRISVAQADCERGRFTGFGRRRSSQ